MEKRKLVTCLWVGLKKKKKTLADCSERTLWKSPEGLSGGQGEKKYVIAGIKVINDSNKKGIKMKYNKI